jgi:FAD synthetase
MPTAAVVVIGNEILSGKFQDANSPWLAKRCRELGIDLGRIVVIPDDVAVIAEAVERASSNWDTVFTSGGIGPTHDDVTMAGVAVGLGVPLVRHPELEDALRKRMGDRVTPAALRMADVPDGAELWWEGELFFPQVVAANVVIFPGVPKLLRMKFDGVAHRFAGGTAYTTVRLTTTEGESAIAARLDTAQSRFPSVDIGSYPQFNQRPFTVTITMDSRDTTALGACEAWLRGALAAGLSPS